MAMVSVGLNRRFIIMDSSGKVVMVVFGFASRCISKVNKRQ